MSQQKYTLTVTAIQAQVIADACDLLSRVQSGQWPVAYDLLPKDGNITWEQWHEARDAIKVIMKTILKDGIDGVASSFGVGSPETPPSSDIAWDIYQVIRHRLAWEEAIRRGDARSIDDGRDWRSMMGVAYDPPMRFGPEPLAKMQSLVPITRHD